MRPFRFGVQLANASSATAWRDLVRRVEDLGYSSVYLPDHFGDQLAPMVALAAAAEATNRLRVGTLVLGNDYRHPVVLAKEAATLDLLSDGRLELGIGAGWMTTDYEQSGIALDEPGVRVERLAEAVTVMKALWSGSCDHRGRHYTITAAEGVPLPVQRPHPTLVIGGGSRRVLELAGREADVVGLNPRLTEGFIGPQSLASISAAHYDERIGWVTAGAGDRLSDIEFQCLTFFVRVVPNGRQVLDDMARMFSMPVDEAAQVPLALIGSESEICVQLAERRRRWGMSYWVVHEDDIDAFAPVVSALAGT